MPSNTENEKNTSRSDLSDTERTEASEVRPSLDSKDLESGIQPATPRVQPQAAPEEEVLAAEILGEKGFSTGPISPPQESDDPPDGGLAAWLQVAGATIVLVDTWGLVNTFGVFQQYYETNILLDNSPSDISWIGSLQASLLLLVGVVSGPLFDAGHFRKLLMAGLFMVVFGMFMTSLGSQYWHFLLAQGFCVGIGMGLLFLPATAILSQYFKRYRALVIGLSSAGSPVAGIVFPIIFSNTVDKVGFGWATRILAFILLALSVIPLVFMKARLPPHGRKTSFIDKSAFHDVPYLAFTAASFFSFLTLYVPFFYMPLYATSHGISGGKFAPYLVTLLNFGSIFGRVVPNALADKYGSLNVLVFCMIGSTGVGYGWFGVNNIAGAVVFSLFYGALTGGVVSLTPSVIVGLAPDLQRLGSRMGMGFLISGAALLVGTPIAGAIVSGYSDSSWNGTMAYAASSLLLSTVLYITARTAAWKKKRTWRF
ncbi:hypothetical protein OQA88_5663 [Cercophora sp. LCS_1]